MNQIILHSLRSELIKIAKSSLKEKSSTGRARRDPTISEVAPYSGGAAAAGLAATYIGAKGKKIPIGTDEILIYYTDRKRGSGHYAQGKALANKLKKKGHKVRLINFDKEFGDPERLKKLNSSFGETLRNRKTRVRHVLEAHLPFYRNIDYAAFKRQAGGGQRVVLANAALEMFSGSLGKPVFVLHTDQASWKKPLTDMPARRVGRANIHIAPSTAVETLLSDTPSLKGRVRSTKGLAIDAPPPKSRRERLIPYLNKRKALRSPGRFNITVSGGGLGLNTAWMTEAILSNPRIKKGTVIHAVAGRGKNLEKLKQLERQTAGGRVQVRAYGFAPLRAMMDQADLNVLRPHGTSITEARSAGKPFLMYLPPGARGMDVNNAKAVSKAFGTPIVTSGTLGKMTESIFSDYSSYARKAKTHRLGPTGGADDIAKIITSTRSVKANPRSTIAWKAGRMGLKGLALGSALAVAADVSKREGLQLLPSKSNPMVKRWQRKN